MRNNFQHDEKNEPHFLSAARFHFIRILIRRGTP